MARKPESFCDEDHWMREAPRLAAVRTGDTHLIVANSQIDNGLEPENFPKAARDGRIET